jgi:hypothetical protein
VWYDSKGKVWQRWNDQVIGGAWDGSLKRYVYDGGQLVQEHLWDVAEDQGSWVYTYNDIDRDYLRHQGGIRQREGTAASYNDFYLQQSGAAIEIKTQRDQASATIARAERTQSLNQMAGTTFTDISNLATSNSPIAMYGGGTSGATGGYDGLMQRVGGGGYLAGPAVEITNIDEKSRLKDYPLVQSPDYNDQEGSPSFMQSSGPGPIEKGLIQLLDQCGEECVEWLLLCIIVHIYGGSSQDNIMYNHCCGIALCPLVVNWDDPAAAWRWFQCRNCLCGSPGDYNCGNPCICEELRNMGYPKTATLGQQALDYFAARDRCRSNCAPCANLPMYGIDISINEENCPEHFSFPTPSCYEICMGGPHEACDISFAACSANCYAHYHNQIGALSICLHCCNVAHSSCIAYEESGKCDPYGGTPR